MSHALQIIILFKKEIQDSRTKSDIHRISSSYESFVPTRDLKIENETTVLKINAVL